MDVTALRVFTITTRGQRATGHFAATRYVDEVGLLPIMSKRKSETAQAAIAQVEAAERKYKTATGRAKQLKEKSREAKRLHKQVKKAAKQAAKAARAAQKLAEEARRDYKKAAARAEPSSFASPWLSSDSADSGRRFRTTGVTKSP